MSYRACTYVIKKASVFRKLWNNHTYYLLYTPNYMFLIKINVCKTNGEIQRNRLVSWLAMVASFQAIVTINIPRCLARENGGRNTLPALQQSQPWFFSLYIYIYDVLLWIFLHDLHQDKPVYSVPLTWWNVRHCKGEMKSTVWKCVHVNTENTKRVHKIVTNLVTSSW